MLTDELCVALYLPDLALAGTNQLDDLLGNLCLLTAHVDLLRLVLAMVGSIPPRWLTGRETRPTARVRLFGSRRVMLTC